MTAILLTCSYHNQEFFRVGYYVNNLYEDPELNENPPAEPEISKLVRHILVEKPRVPKFQIEWDDQMTDENSSAAAANGMVPAVTGELSKGSQF